MIENNIGKIEPSHPEIRWKLRPGLELVWGAKRAALYDLNTGNVYSLNQTAAKVIIGEIDDDVFRSKLVDKGILVNEREHIVGPESEDFEIKLKFAWWEIEPGCNENCIHCYGLFGRPINEQSLDYNTWQRIVRETYEVGCRSAQGIGGEPLMYRGENREDVLDLMEYAKAIGFEELEVFTNGTLLTLQKAVRMAALGLTAAVSVYSVNAQVHDEITQVPGSFNLTMKGISLLLEAGVQVRVGFIVMKQNEQTVDETLDFFEQLGLKGRGPDVVRPTGGGQDDDLMPDMAVQKRFGLLLEPPKGQVGLSKYRRNRAFNPCLAGKIAVTAEGLVLPCIFSREIILGDVHNNTISEIVENSETQRVWTITKDEVMVCGDCEYRYGCHDCRPLSYSTNDKMNFDSAPPARCTYNPYTGRWAEGVWRLTSKGEPVYVPLEMKGGESIE